MAFVFIGFRFRVSAARLRILDFKVIQKYYGKGDLGIKELKN
jgi:hypothetical protein